ncbi:IucA/IucC family protein [Peribacillus simplex]|uniref:IucA/IucC family protein n=1 Tax=Peribacillus simplex TaxID=1478 RepID=A0AAW7I857_9BACI|nr:IucA/IucC family protein [Peribacillus simplex]MDM5292277.1 IucA/IucC family protein [Peribacillus simplex]MDM5451208.1 IucA/IucC family protein [Peribacillus simplex]
MNGKQIAERATMQSFLNCYFRETGNCSLEETKNWPDLEGSIPDSLLVSNLLSQDIALLVPLKYWSETGRHIFTFPIYYQNASKQVRELDYVTMVSIVSKELLNEQGRTDSEDELMLRVILSSQNIQRYVEARTEDADALQSPDFTYIEAEQSLLFGHLFHPTPKSKQGISEKDEWIYSPELKGEFQLHYFLAEPSIVIQDSSEVRSASEIIKQELAGDLEISSEFRDTYCQTESRYSIIPAHPLQAKVLIEKEEVKRLIEQGTLIYVGPLGKKFTATSSFRTVYSATSRYMYKFSVPVKITNSLRANLQKELDRGVEIAKLIDSKVGDVLKEQHPSFRIIKDPAYLTIKTTEQESGFDVDIRENPFYENNEQASLIAGLCQDNAYGAPSRLGAIIRKLSADENRSTEEVSKDWFKTYLSMTLKPMLWLFEVYGIVLEAHQQNSIIQLQDGYPSTFYYRDNQGYYYCESKVGRLLKILPELSEKSFTICSDEVAEERLQYYFFFNHLLGLINNFGTEGLVSEKTLLQLVQEQLETSSRESGDEGLNRVIARLLHARELSCKANLLTRFHDMDELVGSLETQSVYTTIENPFAQGVLAVHEK